MIVGMVVIMAAAAMRMGVTVGMVSMTAGSLPVAVRTGRVGVIVLFPGMTVPAAFAAGFFRVAVAVVMAAAAGMPVTVFVAVAVIVMLLFAHRVRLL